MKTKFVLGVLLLTGSAVYADKPVPVGCENAVKACETAGFEPGDHKKNGKGLWVDCINRVARGKPVSGVTLTQAEAKTCKDAKKALGKPNKK